MKKPFDLEEQENPKDRKKLNNLIENIFKSKRIVERGFYEIMKDIYELKESKLYRLYDLTFKEFCPKKLSMEYKTVNGLLKVYEVTKEFPEHFSEELIIEYGHRKIKTIAYAIVKFKSKDSKRDRVSNKINNLLSKINIEMSAPKIDEIVKEETERIK